MKVNLVKDANGKVIATFENGKAGGPALKPVLQPKYTVHEIDVPESYKVDISALYKQHSR
jgi:hypothetical protein